MFFQEERAEVKPLLYYSLYFDDFLFVLELLTKELICVAGSYVLKTWRGLSDSLT